MKQIICPQVLKVPPILKFAFLSNERLTTMVHTTRAGRLKRVILPQGAPPRRSLHERSVALLFQLIKCFPLNSYILVPRSFDEAHTRSDSMCVILGLQFSVLGPVLLSASVLKVKGSLSYCERGYDVLSSTFTSCN